MVLGKFYPLTMGHKFLIDSAIEKCEVVTLLVCSLKSEHIDGYVRYDWARSIFKDEVENGSLIIKHVQDEVPQEPKGDNDTRFWSIWTSLIYREVGDFDTVFSSETYGDNIAIQMGVFYGMDVTHQLVDLDRETVPISGTMMRNDPIKHWEYIPKVERPYFVNKICVVGTESSGKSIMTEKLAKEFNCPFVTEYGREHVANMENTDSFSVHDISTIASNQLLLEEETAYESENGLMMCDTGLLVTEIFSYLYCGRCPDWVKKASRENKYTLYILLDTSVPFVQDGTREFESRRKEHYNMIYNELYKRDLNFVVISGSDYESRFNDSVEAVKKALRK